ncbi:MAG: 5-deoxy-glucuronate isomerase [Deltaproteobacteria bacterium]|nr:5-deoxy-glucuronate isomerase [Deltaproteobacteria bacterium]
MERTLKKYAPHIEKNELSPLFFDDGKQNGLIVDPKKENVPLDFIGFGMLRLSAEYQTLETMENEMVIVPQEGIFEMEINGSRFRGERLGGPFTVELGRTNASALYVPRYSQLKIRGEGEVAFFTAEAYGDKPPFYISSHEVRMVSRGEWLWRRDVVNLINPKNASTNLIVGETYNPPGLWSGTPPHTHDKDDSQGGESDHEEIYYFRFSIAQKGGSNYAPYAVQLLMDGVSLKKAFILEDRSIFAIPGGIHPIVVSPFTEVLYLWGMAGYGNDLLVKDVPEFAHLKNFEEILRTLDPKKLKIFCLKNIFYAFLVKKRFPRRKRGFTFLC